MKENLLNVYLIITSEAVEFVGNILISEDPETTGANELLVRYRQPMNLEDSRSIYNREGNKLKVIRNFDYEGPLEMIRGNIIIESRGDTTRFREYSVGKSYVFDDRIQFRRVKLLGEYETES